MAKTLVFATAVARSPAATAALRSPTPTFAFGEDATHHVDSKLSDSPTPASPTATEDTTSWSSRLSRHSRVSDDDDGDDSDKVLSLSTEAEALKQQLRRKWPRRLFRFSLRAMRRVVVSPVPIPSDLADPRARIATVSGVHIPLTRQMHLRQKGALMRRRLPDVVDEYVAY